MKKLFILLFVCLSPLLVQAQTAWDYGKKLQGTFTLPESEKYLTIKFDFSKTLFEKKYNETDWALLNGKDDWDEAKQEALERIVKSMNEKMTKTRIIMIHENLAFSESQTIKSSYTMYIIPETYFRNGKNTSLFVLKDNATGEVLGSVSTYGSGGHFGSLANLLGDGFEKSAPEIAKLIAKKNKIK